MQCRPSARFPRAAASAAAGGAEHLQLHIRIAIEIAFLEKWFSDRVWFVLFFLTLAFSSVAET